MEGKTWISNLYFITAVTVTIHCRGGLNPPDDVLKGVFVDAFGRIQSAPTVGGKAICYSIKDSTPRRGRPMCLPECIKWNA